MRSQVGCLLLVAGCMWSGALAAQTIPVPAAKPAVPGMAAALRELAAGPAIIEATEPVPAAPAIGPPPPAADSGRGASSPPEGPLGRLLGPRLGEPEDAGADWGLSVGLRKSAARPPSLPGRGPREEIGLGAGVRVGLSEGVSLGGGYGYFSDDWAGYLRDERSSARADGGGLDTEREHHVAGLRLTFEFEPPAAIR